MDTTILLKAGLTESQAKVYTTLIEQGQLSPVKLASITGESRTNVYMICEKLESLDLVTKISAKKTIYRANHPSALELLAERRRKILVKNERAVKDGIAPFIDLFYASTEMPGARTLQGIEGIKEVYNETLKTANKKIYLLRTTADTPDLGLEYLNNYREQRALKGIHTYALTPVTALAKQHKLDGSDNKMLFHRTFIDASSYTAPVEIDVFGNKVALISFGETQMATIIDSPAIAESIKQLLKLVSSLIAPRVDYDE